MNTLDTLLSSTPGPYTVEYCNDTGPSDDSFWEWYEVAGIKCDSKAQAELIQRLLTFAHSGGAAKLRRALSEMHKVSSLAEWKNASDDAGAALDILDGKDAP